MDNGSTGFLRHEGGAIAIIFCFALTLILLVVGMSLDYGRALGAANKANAALDAAALAAARFMNANEDASDAEVRQIAESFLAGLMAGSNNGITYGAVQVTIDRANGSVTVRSDVSVPTSFTRVVGYNAVTMSNESTASLMTKSVELAMVLDITGSMNRNNRLQDMQDAAKQVIDILLPEGANNGNRIALVPYSASVNIGAGFIGPATDYLNSNDTCVIERNGIHASSEEPPGPGRFFEFTDSASSPRYTCPAGLIMPLSDNRDELSARIDSFVASGWTAGHLGIGWGWYQLSPQWSGFWPADSRPKPYGDTRIIKAMLVMTDGIFNTEYSSGTSQEQALALCDNIKARGITIYSVAFLDPDDPDTAPAAALLQQCASSYGSYFLASNGSELRAAFQQIASNLLSLRLTK
jgi:Flp pilus assembly protein TadG